MDFNPVTVGQAPPPVVAPTWVIKVKDPAALRFHGALNSRQKAIPAGGFPQKCHRESYCSNLFVGIWTVSCFHQISLRRKLISDQHRAARLCPQYQRESL